MKEFQKNSFNFKQKWTNILFKIVYLIRKYIKLLKKWKTKFGFWFGFIPKIWGNQNMDFGNVTQTENPNTIFFECECMFMTLF